VKVERIEDIDVIVKKGKSKIAIVILHGYGASYQDFAPFGEMLLQDVDPSWFFLNGICPVTMGPYETGRSWFPIDMMALEKALNNGTFSEFFKEHEPEGIEEARSRVTNFLKVLREKYDEVYLGGFSQGSMVSADIAFHNPTLVDKLFLLSSTMVAKKQWESACTKQLPFPIFQSHGTNDPVLPISGARDLIEFLKRTENEPEFIEFSGGHEVPPLVVRELENFLRGSKA